MEYRVEGDRYYTETHEWVKMAEGVAIVGISDYAQHALSDLVYIELPAVGKSVEKGSTLVTLESVKAVGEVYAPVSGEVIAVNTGLTEHPEVINEDPFGKGWLVQVQARDAETATAGLLDVAAYTQYLSTV